jgi:hypothetical protein
LEYYWKPINQDFSASKMTLFGSKDTSTTQQQRPRRGPNPMQFPEEGSIPLTEKELRAEGITYCLNQIQSHYQCLARARVRIDMQTESVLELKVY